MEANPTILIKDYEDPKLWDNLEQLDKKREEVVEKQPPEFPNNLGYPNCKRGEQETLLLEFENQIQSVRQMQAFVHGTKHKDSQLSRFGQMQLAVMIELGLRIRSWLCNKSTPDLAPLEAVVFDIDGTLCDSDPLHCIAFCEMFSEQIGMEVPDDEFVSKNIAGKHNDDIAAVLFPDDIPKGVKFLEDVEATKNFGSILQTIEVYSLMYTTWSGCVDETGWPQKTCHR
ncbi:hypothetical protein V6N11_084051 [Hibiscus sabdariffa]|uniref:Uncharacterized protein n=1 Tax=Hibiscus sabdariffa TaxID=183260 RepID=A0ABR2QDC2_9ROSI